MTKDGRKIWWVVVPSEVICWPNKEIQGCCWSSWNSTALEQLLSSTQGKACSQILQEACKTFKLKDSCQVLKASGRNVFRRDGKWKNMLRLIVLLKVQSCVWKNAMCKLAKAADGYTKDSEILLGRETTKLLPHYTLKKNLCCYPRPTEIESSKAVICYQHKTIHLSDGYFGLLLPKLPSSDVSTNLNCDEVSTWLNWTSWYWQLPTLQFGVAKVTFSGNCSKFVLNWIQLCSPHSLTDWLIAPKCSIQFLVARFEDRLQYFQDSNFISQMFTKHHHPVGAFITKIRTPY